MQKTVQLGTLDPLICQNDAPLVIFGGINVLESKELAYQVAERFVTLSKKFDFPFVFKASFDKANRSSIQSFRGPGLQQGLALLAEIKSQFNIPILTDIHEPSQAEPVAEVVDVLQLPAFLCRQTDLVVALAKTQKPINVKKAQFLAAAEMRHILQKFYDAGNENILLCERGTCFGYHNLIVDTLNFPILREFGHPVVFDVTHALQLPGAGEQASGGRRKYCLPLAKAGISQGIAGLFLETHPAPDQAKCDGPSALPLDELAGFLQAILALDRFIKGPPLDQ